MVPSNHDWYKFQQKVLLLPLVERADVQVKVEPMDVKVESIEFTCEKCGKECKNPQALKMHMRFCKE